MALFQRTTRKVDLTQAGEQLMISARKAMAEIDAGLVQIQHAVNVQQGHLSFGCAPTVAGSRLTQILLKFSKKYPGISVRVRELKHLELLEAVRRREVDFGIGPVPEEKGELNFSPIFVDEYFAFLPKGFHDDGRAGIALRELAKMPMLTLPNSSLFRNHMDSVMKANDVETERNYEVYPCQHLDRDG